METSFSSKAVLRIIGISMKQLDYWDRTNLIKPSVREASGYGSVRLYSFRDLLQFKVAKCLTDQGISLQKIRKSLNHLRKQMPEIEQPFARLKFLTDGMTIFLVTANRQKIIDTLENGQYVMSLKIGEFINELKGKTSEMGKDKSYPVTVSRREFKVILHPDLESRGFWVECPELPGCSSQGDSIEEALYMIKDAIKGHLEVQEQLRKESFQKKKVA